MIIQGPERDYWESLFNAVPEMLTAEERKAHLAFLKGVALSSDAFFPFPDSVYRAYQSGVSYIAAPSGSIQDSNVISSADELDLVLVHTSIRLFHH